MMSPSDEQPQPPMGERDFYTTHWSVVLAAGRSDSTRARGALEKLCQTYWYPLYAFVRRTVYQKESGMTWATHMPPVVTPPPKKEG